MSLYHDEIVKINAMTKKLNLPVTDAELAKKLGVTDLIQRKQAIQDAIGNQLGISSEINNAVLKQLEREKDLMRMATSSREAAHAFLEQSTNTHAIAKSAAANYAMASEIAKNSVFNQTHSASAMSMLASQREAIDLYKNHNAFFTMPETSELNRLLENLQIGQVAKFAAIHEIEQKRYIQSITAPWINAVDMARSVYGVLELQGIGNALRLTPGFDRGLTDALRFDFGDWRDKLDFTNFELVNPVNRTDFYISRGFNTALTDMPEEAFEQSLELAGFNIDIANLEFDEGSVLNGGAISIETGLQRTNECHDILQRFERRLRQFIDYLMTKQYGSDWPKKKLQPLIYEKWEEKRKKAESHGQLIPVVELIDFTEYEAIICKKDFWREIFKNIFQRQESVRESFQRLYPIRLATMHSRIVTKEDKLYLCAETVRILRAIKASEK